MGALRFFLLLGLIMILASANVYGSGFSFEGIGVKASGMGGAFRAIADDWSAAYYNPAGYYQIKDNQLAVNTAFFHNRYWITPNVLWGGIYETGFYNDQRIANHHIVSHLIQGGILARLPLFKKETVMGFSVIPLFNQNQRWQLFQNMPAHTDELISDNQYGIKLNTAAYQFTLARGFMDDKLSVGLGLSAISADLRFNELALKDSPISAPLNDRPHDKIPEWCQNEGDGWSFGYRLGLLYDINEKMKFGLTYSGKTSIDISGESQFKFYMGQNPDTIVYVTNQLFEELLFMRGEIIEVISDFETTLDLPATLGGGLAYQATDKLTISLDAELVFWSQFEGFEFKFSNFAASGGPDIFRNREILTDTVYDRAQSIIFENLSIPISWDNAAKVMVGASYKPYNFVDIRAGFAADKSSIDWGNAAGITQIPHFFDLGTKFIYSFGLGFEIGVWSLDLATSYTHQPDYSTTTQIDQNDDGLMDNIAGDYEGENFRTVLGFSYRF